MTDVKGLVTDGTGTGQVLTQGAITRTISHLTATLTLADGTQNDTTINIPAGALCLGWKVEVLTAGATDVNITSLGAAAGGDINILSGDFTLPNEAVGTAAGACDALVRDAAVGALDLYVHHGDVNAGGAKIRVSVMIEQWS